jgi:hypothetical protein
MEREYALTFPMEGVPIYTHLQIAHRVLIDPQIMVPKPFNKSHYKRDWIQQKNKNLTKKWVIFFIKQISLSTLCDTRHL